MKDLVILLFLGWNSWRDVRRREISLGSIGVFEILAGIGYGVGSFQWNWYQLCAILPGILLLIGGAVSGGRIGLGDGLMVTALGSLVSLEEVFMLLAWAFCGAFVYAGIQFMKGRGRRNQVFPFVPFLLAGYVGGMLLWR